MTNETTGQKPTYPMERVELAAKQLPDPVPGAKAFAIDEVYDAVLEFIVAVDRDIKTGKDIIIWKFAGVSIAFTKLERPKRVSRKTRRNTCEKK
jgi:hypothetical protein